MKIDHDQGIDRLRPIIDFISGHGNQLISIESDKIGTLYLYLKDPIDAILLQVNFDFPPCIVVDEDPYYGAIIRDIKNSLIIQQFKVRKNHQE